MSTKHAPTRPMLRVLGRPGGEDGEDEGPGEARGTTYVCTWCALRFPTRAALDGHRESSTECLANQKVSSPLQTRYGDADMVWTQPGEMTLNRVRAGSCSHTHPRARLVDAAGETIGYQCGWCYGLLAEDIPGD